MTEKEILNAIKKSAENIPVPASLQPDALEERLRLQKQEDENGPAPAQPEKSRKSRPPRRKITVYRLGAIAAVFALAVLASRQSELLMPSTQPEKSMVSSDIDEVSAADVSDTGLAASDTSGGSDAPEAASLSAAPEAAESSDATNVMKSAASQMAAPLQEKLTPAKDYETIYQALYDAFGSDFRTRDYGTDDFIVYENAIAEETTLDAAADTGAGAMAKSAAINESGSSSHSSTNVQEQGVDEGDLVKTDGSFIYILRRSGSLVIVRPSQGKNMEEAARIQLEPNENPREMYVNGTTLSIIATEYYSEMDTSDPNVIASHSGTRTLLHTYDISNPEKPVLTGTVTQDGSYSQSRRQGDYLYLFSQFTPEIQDTYAASRIIPGTSSGSLQASDIYLPEHLTCSSYLVVSSVDLNNPAEIFQQKAVVSVPSTFYVSQESIYIANENWNGPETRTELLKLSYRDGMIAGSAAGTLEGYLNNSFSLNEYNGYLRAVTTSYDENYDESNGLYILDEELKPVGAIRDLAPDETIRSARFLGNTGYFVTFRQTDPLFSVDLSDPSNPRILGDLKVTGFSSYLHFYSDTLLLGLGYEADPDTGIQTGLKLSMFDISDPSNVTEVSRLVLDGITWCEALDNYKAILIDPEKNLFGFACDNRYLLFSYKEGTGFVKEFIYDFYNEIIDEGLEAQEQTQTLQEETTAESEAFSGTASTTVQPFFVSQDDASETRGLYIDDTLYLVRPGSVTAFDMAHGYGTLGRLILD